MSALIRVWPARGLRRAFAEWAVAQTPLVRTVSESEFGVPPHLFPQMPEPLLAGARIDGQPYVPSSRPAASARRVASAPLPPPTVPVAEALPEVPEVAAFVPSAVVAVEVAEAIDQAPDEPEEPEEPEEPICGTCQRTFGSTRALKAHQRQAHRDAEVVS